MKLRIRISFGREQWWLWVPWEVCTRARQEGPLGEEEAFDFSGAFSSGATLRPFSNLSVQDWSWGVCVSQFEKGPCFLFLLSHSKEKNCKNTQNKEKPHQNQALGWPGAWTCWFPSGSRGAWQTHLAPGSCCSMDWNHSACERLCRLLQVPPSSPLLSLESKFSWQFQYFQYIFREFSTVHGQIRFSTSHTQTLAHILFLVPPYFVGPPDSNFKMFSAAIKWQNSTFFPILWLIRGGWEEQLIRDTNSFLFLGKSLYSTWNPWALDGQSSCSEGIMRGPWPEEMLFFKTVSAVN